MWFLPGCTLLGSQRQREAANLPQMYKLVGEYRSRWLVDNKVQYLPGITALCERTSPPSAPFLWSYKLSKLSVRPEYHAFGIASALTRPVLQRALHERKRVFGHVTSEMHVLRYKAVGCRVLGAEDLRLLKPVEGGAKKEMVDTIRVWAMEFRPEVMLGSDPAAVEETPPPERILARL
ncbi:hypothetical protein CALVIDRAFT_535783 [Calocera viscosa TUFC12733]|uniref:N-acetyltransferase domain-containing protein n=1 Tax=Calocera viscosa (strain TUFC12733) TaxID=1330018 RepID=A0A167NGP4_CALVF|nr:hypothetical protein CALVIDRAFT_535783 [Calocera viscosa TUFC12733]